MARPVSVRRSLTRNLVALVVLLSGAIIATTVAGSRHMVQAMSQMVIRQTLDQTQAQLELFFQPVIDELLLARRWGEAGLLDLDNPEQLTRLLAPILRRHRAVSSLLVADDRKREHMLLYVDGTWRNRQTRPDRWPGRTRWLTWSDQDVAPQETWQEDDYDPHARPWYAGAVARHQELAAATQAPRPEQRVHWTDLYTFRTTKDPGITASVTFDHAGHRYVIGFDLMLADISKYTMGLRAGGNGVVTVLEGGRENPKLIGLPRNERFADPAARRAALLQAPRALDNPLIADAVAALAARPVHDAAPLRFFSGGQAWWGAGRAFALSPHRILQMGVMVPESDLRPEFVRLRVYILLITLLVLALALWRVMAMARRYSVPIEALVRRSDRISQGDLEPGPPVASPLKEVRQLTAAHDRMRMGLQSLMKLERDMQLARQIQQRTFPQQLPHLSGFELAAWGEPAEATGGDTFDVIGYRAAPDGGENELSTDRADQAVLLLADATGHGIGPALSATEIRAMLRMAVRNRVALARIAHHLNEQLCADLPEGRFITAWLGQLNAADRTLTSFSAGQGPLFRYEAQRDTVELLETDAVPFGVLEDLEISIAAPWVMQHDNIFAAISDGVFEACNGAGEALGLDRLADLIGTEAAASPAHILAAVQEAVRRHTGGVPVDDDRTIIIVKRTGR